jgi:hypothetical protein
MVAEIEDILLYKNTIFTTLYQKVLIASLFTVEEDKMANLQISNFFQESPSLLIFFKSIIYELFTIFL